MIESGKMRHRRIPYTTNTNSLYYVYVCTDYNEQRQKKKKKNCFVFQGSLGITCPHFFYSERIWLRWRAIYDIKEYPYLG